MLDVHPPHEAAHTWKDFFIHIATIVIGLLIAVGLEQTVEYIHHRHQVAETREALRVERELNRKIVADEVVMFRREAAALQNNLLVLYTLKQHPGIARAELPGILTWHSNLQEQRPRTAWITAQQTNVTGLMPATEIRDASRLYGYFDYLTTYANDVWTALGQVRSYSARQSDPTLWSTAEVNTAIDLTGVVLNRLYSFGAILVLLHEDFPEFAPNFTNADLKPLMKVDEGEGGPELQRARALTIGRIDAAGKLHDYFPQADDTQR